MTETLDVGKIKKKLREFSNKRDWDKFHTPKNLSMALSVEIAELVEIFQWSNNGGLDVAQNSREQIEMEIADIFNYLIKFVDLLDIDLERVSLEKIDLNAEKYPINKVKGKAIKYLDL
jgi:dCTP diphosphatase